jgi:hypothetical protein
MTYAQHQEAAAQVLADLVAGGAAVQGGAAVEGRVAVDVLQCRRQALLTLTERMEHLGCLPGRGTPPRRVTVAQVADHPLWHLAGVVDEMARPDLPDVAPSDVLRRPGPEDGPGLAAWRTAARELFLATSVLQRADQQPWLDESSAGWYAVGDVADTVAALVALDARLERAGLLTPAGGDERTVRTLIAGDVARLARMGGQDAAPDDAEAGTRSRLSGDGPPILMVRTPGDLVAAQRHLAALVRPINTGADPRSAEDRPGLRTARVLASGQARLSLQYAAWADSCEGAEQVAAHFRDRASLYRALHAATSRLVDVIPHRSTLPLIQQSELLTQARVLCRQQPDTALLTQLNQASHELAVSLGKALRREAWSYKTIRIGFGEGRDTARALPITNSGQPFNRACRALADEPPPAPTPEPPGRTVARTRLRAALATTATTSKRTPRRMPEGEVRARQPQMGHTLRRQQ